MCGWARKVAHHNKELPSFEIFDNFLGDEAKIAYYPVVISCYRGKGKVTKPKGQRTTSHVLTTATQNKKFVELQITTSSSNYKTKRKKSPAIYVKTVYDGKKSYVV